ncbi:MAG TPA: T9SS type A sorting domain-containing protein [Bacteroidia bacterium]|nr:T9SS type A sorting domain-containing protein [Bacteroidia bacterium]
MAGRFKLIGGRHTKGITRWDGVKWDSLGAGIDGLDTLNAYSQNTLAIITYRNKLYVGGAFSSLGNIKAPSIGTWNKSVWDSLPIQPFKKYSKGEIISMDVINNKLYIGGSFDTVAGFPCIGLAQWNDTNWSSLNFPNFIDFNYISSICEYKGSIYTGGEFYGNTPTDSLHHILRLDSTGWHSVGGGIKGSADDIWSMVIYNGELYVAGEFLKSEGNAGNNIQRWNGTTWNDVGGGTDTQVEHLLVYNGKLYAMGAFHIAGGIPASSIAEWDGAQWCSLGSKFNNVINSTCIYKDSLYIGGGFTKIDNDSIVYIAKWLGGNYTDTCGVLGIDELNVNSERVIVYPNPSSNGVFTVELKVNSEKLKVEVYNVLGENIYQSQLKSESIVIDLSNQPKGIYLYRITSEKGELISTGKLIIQ